MQRIRGHFGPLATLALGSAVLFGCTSSHEVPDEAVQPLSREKRGELLAGIGGCEDCHTPKKLDETLHMPVPQAERRFSGHPEGAPDPASTLGGSDQAVIGPTFTSFRLPFGVTYAANLTPDPSTGLGSWNEEMFVKAMRTGRHMGQPGRPILPPMPWQTLAQQSDDDLRAIYAYLKTLPPVRNLVPAPAVPPPVFEAIGKSYDAMLAAQKKR